MKKVIIFFVFCTINLPFHSAQGNGMKTHAYFTEYFKQNKTKLESRAYELLQEQPLEQNINYIAAPWDMLSNEQIQNLLKELPHLENGFTICSNPLKMKNKICFQLSKKKV